MQGERKAMGRRGPTLETLALVALVTAACAAGSHAGLLLSWRDSHVSLVWPPAGIAIAALLRCGLRVAPGVFLGALIASPWGGSHTPAALVIAAGCTLGPLAAAWRLEDPRRFRVEFARRHDVLEYARTTVVTCALPASIGVTALAIAGPLPVHDVPRTAVMWWLGDVVGALVVGPVLLMTTRDLLRRLARERHITELVATMLAVLASSLVAFVLTQAHPVSFIALPFVAWSAMRFGSWGSSAAVAIVTIVAVAGTIAGRGPYHQLLLYEGLPILAGFLVTVALFGLLVGSLHSEQQDAHERMALEHHAAAGALRELTNRQYAFDQHAIVAITDVRGRICYVNDRFCTISGYSRDELIGQDHRVVNSGHHPKAYFADMYRTIAQGGVWRGEICNRAKDGRLYWVDTTVVPLVGSHGRPERYIAIRTDVSERKRTEHALREAQSRFARAVRGTSDGIWETNLETGATFYSERVFEQLEYAADEHPSHDDVFLAHLHPDDRGRLEAARDAHLLHDAPFDVEIRLRTKPGEYRWFRARARAERSPDGRRTLLAGSLSDITEHRRAMDALRESERRFVAFMDASLSCAWIKDEAGRYVFVNRALPEEFGNSALEWLGHTDADLFPPEVARTLRANDALVMASGRPYESVEHLPLPSGEVREWMTTKFPLVANGRRYTGGVAVDITERRRAEAREREVEERLRQAQKLQAVGTLAGGVAHDINNVLGIVMGNVELAQLDAPTDHPVQESLAQIALATRRARDVIRQMLAFSRPQETDRRPLALAEAVADTLDLMRASLPKTVDLRLSIEPGLPLVVADHTQIQQVVMNLCANASQALHGRTGCIEVTLTRIDGAQHPELRAGPWVRLRVRDTGTGMDEATLARIFEPFFTTRPPGEGTGLGLAVVHGIVGAHGGVATVHSRAGEGTTFDIDFPAAPPADGLERTAT